MVSNSETCPICKLERQQWTPISSPQPKTLIECERCGRFTITNAVAPFIDPEKPLSYKLIAWIRDFYEKGADPPQISRDTLKNVETNLPDYGPGQKTLLLLRNMERRTEYPGEPVTISPGVDYPLSWAKNEKELLYYLRSLLERSLIGLPSEENKVLNGLINQIEITAAGWDFLEKNAQKSSISDQVFVAMSFSPELTAPWENGIKKAIENAGYNPYRVDSEPHADRIDVKIMTDIKDSRFLVADVTGQRQGVYFEAGYALGLGMPVIWTCKKGDFGNVHFDTRQYNHILWESEDQLRETLYNFICAIIGKGPKTRTAGSS